uniref:Uncharacterized protein n=1 Tax=Ciona intestinalis TaxID=7719 RepID=H2XUV0_CIOIN
MDARQKKAITVASEVIVSKAVLVVELKACSDLIRMLKSSSTSVHSSESNCSQF